MKKEKRKEKRKEEIVFAQLDVHIGNAAESAAKVCAMLKKYVGAQLVIFPELFIGGYPPRDFLLSPSYRQKVQQALQQIANFYANFYATYAKNARQDILPPCVLGAPLPLLNSTRKLVNAAIYFASNGSWQWRAKTALPSYDVFFEKRYFVPPHFVQQNGFNASQFLTGSGRHFFVLLCEDMWQDWLLEAEHTQQIYLRLASFLCGNNAKVGANELFAGYKESNEESGEENNKESGNVLQEISALAALQRQRGYRTSTTYKAPMGYGAAASAQIAASKTPETPAFYAGQLKKNSSVVKLFLKQNSQCQLAVNLSASPFELGKKQERVAVALHTLNAMVAAKSARGLSCSCAIALVNQVGGNDELLFDGSSFLLSYEHGYKEEAEEKEEAFPFLAGAKKNAAKNVNRNVNGSVNGNVNGSVNITTKILAEGRICLQILPSFQSLGQTLALPEGVAGMAGGKLPQNKVLHKKVNLLKSIAKAENLLAIGAKKVKKIKKIKKKTATGALHNFLNLPMNLQLAASLSEESANEIMQALVMGIKGYAKKSGFTSAVIGLSGGIDSAVTASLAVMALGGKNVHFMAMPSAISSKSSLGDAHTLASNLGMPLMRYPIRTMVFSVIKQFAKNCGMPLSSLAIENLQSRIRGLLLMAYSNSSGALLLTTGNKSEVATGYCTLYGDTNGGLSVLGDCYKSDVYALALAINRYFLKKVGKKTEERTGKKTGEGIGEGFAWPAIPQATFFKAPSAELAQGQQDDDSLPPYNILDAILFNLLQRGVTAEHFLPNISNTSNKISFDEAAMQVRGLLKKSEYKRKQMPPVLRISYGAFGMGRMIPLVAKF